MFITELKKHPPAIVPQISMWFGQLGAKNLVCMRVILSSVCRIENELDKGKGKGHPRTGHEGSEGE